MSSTPELERGQALPIFILSLTVLFLAAALAFDGGQLMLERRDQQNAADAAAIAGARYVVEDTAKARDVAFDVAEANGFDPDDGSQSVDVNIPPLSGPHAGKSGYIEVVVGSTRPSLIAGIAGIADWDVGARAVAVNENGAIGAFSILELDPHGCAAFKVSGQGLVEAHGDIHVNSDCDNGAFVQAGGGTITVDTGGGYCKVYSDDPDAISSGGSGELNCIETLDAGIIDDPLAGVSIPDPLQLGMPADMELIPADPDLAPPDGCPGSVNEPVPGDTKTYGCSVPDTKKYGDKVWRLYPGVYLGGLKLYSGTFYLEPGVYYLAGGGLDIGPDVGLTSVDPGGDTLGGGVMFYNTAARVNLGTDSAIEMPMDVVVLNGGNADVEVLELDRDAEGNKYPWAGIVLWQDRDLAVNGDDITINGGDSDMILRGTVYAAQGDLKVNGDEGTITLDQLINYTSVLNGGGGNILAHNDIDHKFKVRLAGLIE